MAQSLFATPSSVLKCTAFVKLDILHITIPLKISQPQLGEGILYIL